MLWIQYFGVVKAEFVLRSFRKLLITRGRHVRYMFVIAFIGRVNSTANVMPCDVHYSGIWCPFSLKTGKVYSVLALLRAAI